MRVVIDTNVWVSRLLIADSVAARAVQRALSECEVMVSEACMEELAEVLARGKFDRYVSLEDRKRFIRAVLRVTTLAPVLSEVADCRDYADNQFLALAWDSESDCIVTGDSDLLELDPWREIPIVRPAEFLSLPSHKRSRSSY